MSAKPELIVFSQYLLGGGASFHRNLLAHIPEEKFDLKVIYLFPKTEAFAPTMEFVPRPRDVIFEYGDERLYDVAKRLSTHISDRAGAIVTNLGIELDSLDFFPRRRKTVYFVCHDAGFLDLAQKFHHIIDLFIAHNREIYETLRRMLPDRQQDMVFIPHGVAVQSHNREPNKMRLLRVAFLARHHVMKGILDLPEINRMLLNRGIHVEWLIMGDGPERPNFVAQTRNLANFSLVKPETNQGVLEQLKQCDIFILPSRKDGLPVALLESMSVGCVPLVSAFSDGIREVVSEDVGYVVAVGDNEGFAERIAALDQNRDGLASKSVASMARIAGSYDVKSRAKQYFDLYANYAAHKKPPRSGRPWRPLRKAYYFLVSKLAAPLLVRLKRKLFRNH